MKRIILIGAGWHGRYIAGAVVIADVEDGAKVLGIPAHSR